ncbi:hypothetical protein Tco_0629081 [Tanacetum coccineum]|uniref:Uncharacterized protein n=1 Tax=Tanacetum coccineum TaxID=301880 RepID=A0ABQ4WS43_9ASTR
MVSIDRIHSSLLKTEFAGRRLNKPLQLLQVKDSKLVLSSHASGLGADEETGVSPGVFNVPIYRSDDEQIFWKSSDEEDDDEVSMTESDNDDDTFDNKERQDEEDKEEKWSDDETSDEESQGGNDEKDKMDEEETNKDEEVNKLYRDININLEGRDTEMENANVQATQVIEDTHVIITAVTPETISLVDVPVFMNVEMPPSSVTPLPPPPIPFIQPQQ